MSKKELKKPIQPKKEIRKDSDTNGFLLPAGLLIGIGFGLLSGQVAAFTLIGLGCGFIGMYFGKRK